MAVGNAIEHDTFKNRHVISEYRLVRFQPPKEAAGVRVDTGVQEGGEIPMFYDSMIAKLIVHGRDRAEAIARKRRQVSDFMGMVD